MPPVCIVTVIFLVDMLSIRYVCTLAVASCLLPGRACERAEIPIARMLVQTHGIVDRFTRRPIRSMVIDEKANKTENGETGAEICQSKYKCQFSLVCFYLWLRDILGGLIFPFFIKFVFAVGTVL